jgi:hypothetical protein
MAGLLNEWLSAAAKRFRVLPRQKQYVVEVGNNSFCDSASKVSECYDYNERVYKTELVICRYVTAIVGRQLHAVVTLSITTCRVSDCTFHTHVTLVACNHCDSMKSAVLWDVNAMWL